MYKTQVKAKKLTDATVEWCKRSKSKPKNLLMQQSSDAKEVSQSQKVYRCGTKSWYRRSKSIAERLIDMVSRDDTDTVSRGDPE